jgi:hypothetical protein
MMKRGWIEAGEMERGHLRDSAAKEAAGIGDKLDVGGEGESKLTPR